MTISDELLTTFLATGEVDEDTRAKIVEAIADDPDGEIARRVRGIHTYAEHALDVDWSQFVTEDVSTVQQIPPTPNQTTLRSTRRLSHRMKVTASFAACALVVLSVAGYIGWRGANDRREALRDMCRRAYNLCVNDGSQALAGGFLEEAKHTARNQAPALVQACADQDGETLKGGVLLLGLAGSRDESVSDFVGALYRTTVDEEARFLAAFALAETGSATDDVRIPLMHALGSDNPAFVALASDGLVAIGAPAVPDLVSALADQTTGSRQNVARVLIRIGPSAVTALAKGLRNPAGSSMCAAVLAQIGPDAIDAIPLLLDALVDERVEDRDTIALAIARIDSDAEPRTMVNQLTQFVERKLGKNLTWNRTKQWKLERTLELMGVSAVAPLSRQLQTQDPRRRLIAAEMLRIIGVEARAGVPALTSCLTSEAQFLPLLAARALHRVDRDEPHHGSVLADALQSDDPSARLLATETLNIPPDVVYVVHETGAMSPWTAPQSDPIPIWDPNPLPARYFSDPPRLIPKIAFAQSSAAILLSDEPRTKRKAAARTLLLAARYSPSTVRTAIPTIVQALTDEAFSVRCLLLLALEELGPSASPAIPSLILVLQDIHPETRYLAARAITSIGPASVPHLVRTLESDDPRLRADAAKILGTIGTAAKDAVQALQRALNDEAANVRDAAQEALDSIEAA